MRTHPVNTVYPNNAKVLKASLDNPLNWVRSFLAQGLLLGFEITSLHFH